MFSYDIRLLTENSALKNALSSLRESLEKQTQDTATLTGAQMVAEIKESLSVPADIGAKTSASAPFEPPRMRSGSLKNAIGFRSEISERQTLVKVGDLDGKVSYAPYLEYGTVNMKARPFLLPALLKYAAILSNRIKETISKTGGNAR